MSKERASPVSPSRSVRPPPTDRRPKNRLLAALPADDFRRLARHLKTVAVGAKHVLHKQGEPVRQVYFPNGGVVSIVSVLSDGKIVETATVGDEGMLGIEAFLSGNSVAPGDTVMRVPNTSVEMLGVNAFRREIARRGALHHLMGRYAQVVIAQMMQSMVCSARHQMPQRCARWLLMTHDRMHRQDFILSHEALAVMLGAQRPSVSAVAVGLQRAGLIRYTHGRVTVRDRKGLKATSCECYAIIRGHYDGLRH